MEKPMFIKLEEYNQIRDLLVLIKGKIDEAKSAISRINQLRLEEEREIASWSNEIEEVEKKLAVIDEALISSKE
ncbi:MAG: hypothetical protein N3D84_02125 [Candidatus Woesearchaeota archaeon]|nr:hypothetical protein [Candidatus Woesearchaeota archaeon]